MKKVLHILSQRPGKTGSGIFLQSLIGEMDKKGYQQGIVVGIPVNDEIDDLKDLRKHSLYPVRFETEEVPFPVVGMSDVMPYKSTKYKELTDSMFYKWKNVFEKTIKNAIYDFQPDLIISHHLWILSSFVREWALNIPMMSICHGTGLRQLKQVDKFSHEVMKGCRKINKIFALNAYQREEIHRLYGINRENIVITGSGYNGDIFYPKENKKNDHRIRIVYAGKLSYAKGVTSLLRAYNELQIDKNLIELTLVGGGSGEEFEEILKMAENSPYKVVLTGAVHQRKLGEIFRQSDLFILPSFYEGLPLVLIEALASDLRVVSSHLPGVKEWMGDEINDSGMIEYVKLPTLKNADMPLLEELPSFEEGLKRAMEKQIQSIFNKENPKDPEYIRSIEERSWKGLFSKMESNF